MGFSRVDVERALVALQAVALCSLGAAAVLGVIDFTRSGAGLAVPITGSSSHRLSEACG